MIVLDEMFFQSRDHKVKFISLVENGTKSYQMEDFQGKVITMAVSPDVLFDKWTRDQIHKLMDSKE